jgi:hypothetical protein
MKRLLHFFLVIIAVFSGLGALGALIHHLSDSTVDKEKGVDQAEAVMDHLQGKIGFPGTFKDFCGEPDHYRNSPNGALLWVYEQPKVVVSFIKSKKTDEYWHLYYDVYDPVRFAEWSEIQLIDPKEALSRIGCKIPVDFQRVLATEKSIHDSFVFNSAFEALRRLRSAAGAPFRLKSAQMTADESVCYRFDDGETNVNRAVLFDGDLVRKGNKQFGVIWGRECEGKNGLDETAGLLKVLAAWDHAE